MLYEFYLYNKKIKDFRINFGDCIDSQWQKVDRELSTAPVGGSLCNKGKGSKGNEIRVLVYVKWVTKKGVSMSSGIRIGLSDLGLSEKYLKV